MMELKTFDRKTACHVCLRPAAQCICSRVDAMNNRTAVLILQFPREQYKQLNSARLVNMALKNSVLRIGLSWPNLTKALGRPAAGVWAVLYLGSGGDGKKPVEILNRKKQPVAMVPQFEGIIALDGTWKQAKTLWWRNPWLLKLHRIVLNVPSKSLRPQVKRQALSTAEAVSFALEELGEDKVLCKSLRMYYERLIIAPNLNKSPTSRLNDNVLSIAMCCNLES